MEIERAEGSVERTYRHIKGMAASYAFKPEARINESELAKQLSTSRTPLREALNRLVAEGFLTFKNGQGFFCRSLTPSEIMNLYEARAAIECEAVRLASLRATDAQLDELETFLRECQTRYQPGTSPVELVQMDEAFHLRLTALSGNAEMVRMLENMNGRIHYIRLIDLKHLSARNGLEVMTIDPHKSILKAVRRRDVDGSEDEMRKHIERRLEAIKENVRYAFAELYAP